MLSTTGAKWLLAVIVAVSPIIGVGLTGTPAAARGGPTCGWCFDFDDGGAEGVHHFPNGGDQCGWPTGEECARCGGTSACHEEFDVGPCHIACGGGNFTAFLSELESELEAGDTNGFASWLAAAPDAFAVHVALEGTSLMVRFACEKGELNATYPLASAMAGAAQAALSD